MSNKIKSVVLPIAVTGKGKSKTINPFKQAQRIAKYKSLFAPILSAAVARCNNRTAPKQMVQAISNAADLAVRLAEECDEASLLTFDMAHGLVHNQKATDAAYSFSDQFTDACELLWELEQSLRELAVDVNRGDSGFSQAKDELDDAFRVLASFVKTMDKAERKGRLIRKHLA